MVKPSTKVRKKVKKNVAEGIAHVHASFNNTIVTITARIEKLLRRCEMVPSRKVVAGCRQVFTRYLPLFFL